MNGHGSKMGSSAFSPFISTKDIKPVLFELLALMLLSQHMLLDKITLSNISLYMPHLPYLARNTGPLLPWGVPAVPPPLVDGLSPHFQSNLYSFTTNTSSLIMEMLFCLLLVLLKATIIYFILFTFKINTWLWLSARLKPLEFSTNTYRPAVRIKKDFRQRTSICPHWIKCLFSALPPVPPGM